MKKILIIDDSALMRRVISDIIKSDVRFIVGDTATNGLEGFDLITREDKKYDAVILDINMPRMNGIEFLEALEKHRVKTKVIVVSTVAKEGAKETIRALELGAFDFVTKPESFLEVKSDQFKNRLMERICAAVNLDEIQANSMVQVPVVKRQELKSNVVKRRVERTSGQKLVALACSTGGPKALQGVLPLLPKNFNSSILIVQHMPAGFTNSLAIRLNEISQITVKEAKDGEIIQKGVAYIAMGGKHLKLVKGTGGTHKIAITDEPAKMGLKPCADLMYESLTDAEFDEITCVVLTGMGADGTKGITTLKQRKELYVIAQDEATSTVYGMPKVITSTGLVDEVVPLNEVADAMVKNVGVR